LFPKKWEINMLNIKIIVVYHMTIAVPPISIRKLGVV